MKYDINPKQWRKVFALPSVVAENYIKLASSNSMKVIVFIAFNSDKIYSPKEIADSVGISEEAAEEGIIFWKNVGVLCEDCTLAENPAPEISAEPAPERIPTRKTPVKNTSRKIYRPSEIAERINEDAEIKFLFSNAENAFARILTHTEQSSLIWIHDYLGLSPEIIIMMMEFKKQYIKLTACVIETTAQEWFDKGITDVLSAESEIERFTQCYSKEYKVKSIFGIQKRNLSSKEQGYVAEWSEKGFSDELIKYAYDKTVDATGSISFAYSNKILLSWEKNGLTTIEQIDAFESAKQKPKKAVGSVTNSNTSKSYDFDKLKNLALNSGGKE